MLLLASLLLPQLPECEGSSHWTETAIDTLDGDFDGTCQKAPVILLDTDTDAPPDWYVLDDGVPIPRYHHAAVYTTSPPSIVVFGGMYDPAGYHTLNDTWVYDFNTDRWRNAQPKDAPSRRAMHSMAYDRANGVVVLFGGMDFGWMGMGYFYNDTWTYNVSRNVWTQMKPSNAPMDDVGHMMAYNEARGAVVLFGGYIGGNETWTYSVRNDTWTQMRPTEAPPPRYEGSMVYDARIGACVLFGGKGRTGCLNDTWSYDLGTNAWAQVETAEAPPARRNHTIVYDRGLEACVVFGGEDSLGSYRSDTWYLDRDGPTWREAIPEDPPPNRSSHAMVYADRSNATIVLGGLTRGTFLDVLGRMDCLDAHLKDWRGFYPWGHPQPRTNHSMAYDRRWGVSVLFGGFDESDTAMNDTWFYDSSDGRWQDKSRQTRPPARGLHAMVYDPRHGVFILFGGWDGDQYFNDTWVFDARDASWSQKAPALSPSARADHAMTFDTNRGLVLLFGGRNQSGMLADLWVYDVDDDSWTRLDPLWPPRASEGQRMAYDESADLTVMLFWSLYVYIFNMTSNSWTHVEVGSEPMSRSAPAVAYDTDARRVVVYGGERGFALTDVWSYDVTSDSWSELSPERYPGGRCDHAMAYDQGLKALVCFGGSSDANGRIRQSDTRAFGSLGYNEEGTYVSEAHDCGGAAYFGNITWDDRTPEGTRVELQLRTADTLESLKSAPFLGPDATPASRYACGSEPYPEIDRARMPPVHNGSRWVQYKVFLSTSDAHKTPALESVRIEYNLAQGLSIASPSGGESWTGVHWVSWNATDPDGDELTFTVRLLSGPGSTVLAEDLPNGTTGWSWDASATPNGRYRIMVSAVDDDTDIPLQVDALSPEFEVSNPPPPNHAPFVELLGPENGGVIDALPAVLTWNGSDADGDPLTYTVFVSSARFDATALPFPPAAITTARSLSLTDLVNSTTYYWTVVATDGRDNGSVPGVRQFLLTLTPPPTNHLPVATLVGPTDGAVLPPGGVTLVWEGSDGDGDVLRYFLLVSDVRFLPEDPTPVPILTGSTSFIVEGPGDGLTVWWAVVPNDGKANGSMTPVWSFRIEPIQPPPPNDHAPRFTSQPPLYVIAGTLLVYDAFASDEDGDVLTYTLAEAPPGMAIDGATGRLTWTPDTSQVGDRPVRVLADDGHGGVAEQRFTITVLRGDWVRPGCLFDLERLVVTQGERAKLGGTAREGSATILRVEVRVDGGAWANATGRFRWSFALETGGLSVGKHVVEARAWDGTTFSDAATLELVVGPRTADAGGSPLMLSAVVIIIVVLFLCAALLLRKRSTPP